MISSHLASPFSQFSPRKIKALQMPLSRSLRLRHFLLFFTITISSWLASYCHGTCQVFKCGSYTLDYPFGLKNSGCGDPHLQLDCDHVVSMPVLDISGHQYYILEPKTYSELDSWKGYYIHNMTILDQHLQEDECDLSENIYQHFFTGFQFHIAIGDSNITLGRTCVDGYSEPVENIKCKKNGYYNFSSEDSSISCQSKFQLPVSAIEPTKSLDEIVGEGLNITWTASEDCTNCESGYRDCSSRNTPSFCYCGGTSYLQKCPNGKSKTLIILGSSIGGGVALAAILFLFLIFRVKRRKHSATQNLRLAVEPSISKVEKFLQDYTHQMPTRYSYSELKKITNYFGDKLGEGGFGVVYKGKLPSGNLVAVKILDQSRQSEAQFMNEVATIGTLHHVHLVRLMGYCYEGAISHALVYEYMANGSLEKFIFAGRGEERILSWEQLYSIALGAAHGIAYLHEDCHNRIIHFDIKPHNILLDEEFRPKVADFGLAKLCRKGDDHMSMTAARGTPGYVAPEVWCRNLGPVTDKSDVYSFGMLLLEMVGGRKNIELVSRSSEVYFPEWAFKLLEKGQLEMMLRGRGRGSIGNIGMEDEEKARKMTKVGLWCIQYNSIDRPSMSRVVQMLERNGDDVANPPRPFNSSPGPQPEAALLSSTEDFSAML